MKTTINPRIVRVEEIVEQEGGVTLELSMEEAQVIHDICFTGITGGGKDRHISDCIHNSLQAAGMTKCKTYTGHLNLDNFV